MLLPCRVGVDASTDTFPGKMGAIVDNVPVEIIVQVDVPCITKGAVHVTSGHAAHK